MVRSNFRVRWGSLAAVGALAIVLAIVSVARARNAINQKKRALARAELAAIKSALSRYYIDNGYFPTTEQDPARYCQIRTHRLRSDPIPGWSIRVHSRANYSIPGGVRSYTRATEILIF